MLQGCAWGIAAECLGLSRADLLENLVKQNQGTFPFVYSEKPVLETKMTFNKERIKSKSRSGFNRIAIRKTSVIL